MSLVVVTQMPKPFGLVGNQFEQKPFNIKET